MKFLNILKNNSKTIVSYLAGLGIVFAALYYFVLQHPGYIYFWDMSGSYDFREPLRQYLNLYTPYDGNTVGVANRIPLTLLTWLIYKPLEAILGLSAENMLTISLAMVYISAYTVFFTLFNRWRAIFSSENEAERGESSQLMRLIFSILYLLLPFFAYRLPQLHLFFMSAFYPLHVYLFIKLLTDAKRVGFYLPAFVISLFFGLSSPHIIFFEVITFLPILFFYTLANITKVRQLILAYLRLGIAGLAVGVTHAYWLVPYLFLSTPDPGYVVNEGMISQLSRFTDWQNYLIGQSEWFIDQANLRVLSGMSSLRNIQLLGLISAYVIGAFYILRNLKNKFIWAIVLLLTFTSLLVVNEFPFHKQIFESIFYTKWGWVIREPNKLHMIWSFWTFLFFALGFEHAYRTIRRKGILGKVFALIAVAAIVPYVIYSYPINHKFFTYAKPVEISQDVKEMFKLLKDDPDYFYVHYYPSSEPYIMDWKAPRFNIADTVEYRYLPYNSPKPPTRHSTVVPHQDNFIYLYTEYVLNNSADFSSIGEYVNAVGVKYVVIRLDAKSVSFPEQVNNEVFIEPTIQKLENDKNFEEVLRNTSFIVYRNKAFTEVKQFSNYIYTQEGFEILKQIEPEILQNNRLVFCNFTELASLCDQDAMQSGVKLYESGSDSGYLSYLSREDRELYAISPFNHTKKFGGDVEWGRASFYDRINGPIHGILRGNGVNAHSYDISDEIAYSTHTLRTPGETSRLTFQEGLNCRGSCEVYAYVLHSKQGGELRISVDAINLTINTRTEEGITEEFKWVNIGTGLISSNAADVEGRKATFNLTTMSGLQAVGPILVIPSSKVDELELDYFANNSLVLNEENSSELIADGMLREGSCDLSTEYSYGIIPQISIEGECEGTVYVRPHGYESATFVKSQEPADSRYYYSDAYRMRDGQNRATICVVSEGDVFLWSLLAIDVISIGLFAFIMFYHPKRTSTEVETIEAAEELKAETVETAAVVESEVAVIATATQPQPKEKSDEILETLINESESSQTLQNESSETTR